MDDRSGPVGWTDAQWNRVRQAVSDEAGRARVAASFLPIYGPLPSSTQIVPSEIVDEANGTVDDTSTTPILEIKCEVALSQQQVQEEDLSSALLLFRRAANVVARWEDWIIFNGQRWLFRDEQRQPDIRGGRCDVTGGEKAGVDVRDGGEVVREPKLGQMDPRARRRMTQRLLFTNPGAMGLIDGGSIAVQGGALDPNSIVTGIVRAVSELESNGHLAPFVCVLGNRAFEFANTPAAGLVLPRDRIEAFLSRELLRSGTIDQRRWEQPGQDPQQQAPQYARGVVVSLAGDPVDLAVSVDPSPQFLYIDQQARYVFRVYERFALRIKESAAVARLEFE